MESGGGRSGWVISMSTMVRNFTLVYSNFEYKEQMAHKRKEFTENQKAEIFVRDKATCAFSGISLWLLDNGIKSNWQIDWVDHIKPSASGGGAVIENGICASAHFNSKKKNNAHDNIYFVREGILTEHYLEVFGTPPRELIERLKRLKKLESADWFFNRCISGIFVGYDWRCAKEFKGITYKRTDNYWFKSGWNRLQKFHKKKGTETIRDRGLVKKDVPFGTDKLLALEKIETEKVYREWLEENYASYRASYKAFFQYFNLTKVKDRPEFILELEENLLLHPEVKRAIKTHHIVFQQ